MFELNQVHARTVGNTHTPETYYIIYTAHPRDFSLNLQAHTLKHRKNEWTGGKPAAQSRNTSPDLPSPTLMHSHLYSTGKAKLLTGRVGGDEAAITLSSQEEEMSGKKVP